MSTDLSSKTPDVSVIIPHFNQADALALCLESIRRQNIAPSTMEVIIVDNQSTCDMAPIKARFSDFTYLTETKRGAAHARNAGIKASNGQAFAFIDADCIADPDWLRNGLAALEKSDLVGGDVRVTTADQNRPNDVEAFECVFAFRQRRYIKRKHFAVTANLFATRKAAEAIGPFKNGIAEDMEWCLRGRALGFRLAFNDTSIISHPARKSWDELTAKWDRLISERWNGVGGRSLIGQVRWAGLAVATALSTAPHLLFVLFSRRISGARNRIAAAGVLARIRFWRARQMLARL